MARSLVAYYESVYSAQKAVNELTGNGFSKDMISLLVPNLIEGKEDLRTADHTDLVDSEVTLGRWSVGVYAGMGIGAALGIAGMLLLASGTVQLPGIGELSFYQPVSLVTTLLAEVGALATTGGLLGGLIGSVVGLGIPEEEVRQYAKNIRQGKVLVSILADRDLVDQAIEILNHHRPLQVKEERISHERIEQIGNRQAKQPLYVKPSEQEQTR